MDMRLIRRAILAGAFSPLWLDLETPASPTALECGGFQSLHRWSGDCLAPLSTISAFDDSCGHPSHRPSLTSSVGAAQNGNRSLLAIHSLSRSGHHQFPRPLV